LSDRRTARPSGPDLSYHAALWPAHIVSKNASKCPQELNQIFPKYYGVFTTITRQRQLSQNKIENAMNSSGRLPVNYRIIATALLIHVHRHR
jgi:hypothetical protein